MVGGCSPLVVGGCSCGWELKEKDAVGRKRKERKREKKKKKIIIQYFIRLYDGVFFVFDILCSVIIIVIKYNINIICT